MPLCLLQLLDVSAIHNSFVSIQLKDEYHPQYNNFTKQNEMVQSRHPYERVISFMTQRRFRRSFPILMKNKNKENKIKWQPCTYSAFVHDDGRSEGNLRRSMIFHIIGAHQFDRVLAIFPRLGVSTGISHILVGVVAQSPQEVDLCIMSVVLNLETKNICCCREIWFRRFKRKVFLQDTLVFPTHRKP